MAVFTLDVAVAKFAEKINLGVATVVRKIAVDLHTKITKRTPVDTGRARASWMLTEGAPSDVAPDASAFPKGKTAPAPPTPDVAAIDGKKSVFIVSNLIYIEPLENGHSKQAPAGMVAVSLAEVKAEIEQTIQQLEK